MVLLLLLLDSYSFYSALSFSVCSSPNNAMKKYLEVRNYVRLDYLTYGIIGKYCVKEDATGDIY